MPDIPFDASDITPFKADPLNIVYILIKIILIKPGKKIKYRKQLVCDFIRIMDNDFNIAISEDKNTSDILYIINSYKPKNNEGLEYIQNSILNLFQELNIDIQSEEALFKQYNDYFEKSLDRIDRYNLENNINYFYRCFEEKKGIVINSIHGIKGQEFTTVIAFGLLHGYVPNWSLILDRNYSEEFKMNESKKLLYVLASRAKRNIYIFSERGRLTKRKNEYEPNSILSQYHYKYD